MSNTNDCTKPDIQKVKLVLKNMRGQVNAESELKADLLVNLMERVERLEESWRRMRTSSVRK